jgi:hypothetical protein
MATSPSHRFGQIIGDLLEEIMTPLLQAFCDERGLYLDKKGYRGEARGGKKVSWIDKYGNTHDLDFVIEKDGSDAVRGRPLAFIEAAWRRYTKHSRNKAQEIQGAILPVAEKYGWDKPFLGVILAGVFTSGSITQMKSSGFDIALFPYDSIVKAFLVVGIKADFDEDTSDVIFKKTVKKIETLKLAERAKLKKHLVDSNKGLLDNFFGRLQSTLDRQIEKVILIPLYGKQNEFAMVSDAIAFVTNYQEVAQQGGFFRKFELIVQYSNNDKIEASFRDKENAINFLHYIEQGIN